ncbi:MAG: hypothetical protein IJ638_00470 [Alphaproteobacteria bacterium]|nr:hypothetical protein [Alphaproteobacteria bacterium]
MKKSILLLLALAGCVRLNYIDIPAENTYKFRYVGEDALEPCIKEENLMCEKDGITPANGIWVNEINNGKDGIHYRVYNLGREIADELYDENVGAGITGLVNVDGNFYTYCIDGKLCNITCNNAFGNKMFYITGEALNIWLKAKGTDALNCKFIEGYLAGYYGKEEAKKLISKNQKIADTSWDFIRYLKKEQEGNPEKK